MTWFESDPIELQLIDIMQKPVARSLFIQKMAQDDVSRASYNVGKSRKQLSSEHFENRIQNTKELLK